MVTLGGPEWMKGVENISANPMEFAKSISNKLWVLSEGALKGFSNLINKPVNYIQYLKEQAAENSKRNKENERLYWRQDGDKDEE